MKKLTIDDFEKKYELSEDVRSLSEEYEDREGMFDATDEDLEVLSGIDAKRIWTQVDNEDGGVCYKAGLLADAIMFVVTDERWESEDEEYVISYES